MEIRGAGWVRENRIEAGVLAAAFCIVILWTTFALTPSSYGGFLTSIGAEDTGLIAGQARQIRADEWAIWTPYFQATVRNGFERFNHTSFYGEDLRNMNALPLRDWGIVFKPQLWAFFVLPPANAYGCYFGSLMAAFLAGYFFLFRELRLDGRYAIAASFLLFCCGFSQFWWTTLAPSLSFFPWVAVIVLRPGAWFVRFPLLTYALTTWVIADPYPIVILSCALFLLVCATALRSDAFRSGARFAATVGGVALGLGLIYWYFADLMRAISHTAYPGQRRAPSGTVPWQVLVSQFWPSFSFRASDYTHLLGLNICEIGAVGSFLPVLTICCLDYSRLRQSFLARDSHRKWLALAIFGLCLGLSTWWMAGSCPRWIGHLLYWDRFTANRLLFLSGLLVLTAAFLPWQRGLVAVTPLRAAVFVALGPIASAIAKMKVFAIPAADLKVEWVCAALAAACAISMFVLPRSLHIRLLLFTVIGMNALLFLRFNPLQSAYPIFEIPDNNVLDGLTLAQSQTPGGYIAVKGYRGATLNGLGLRSVSHVLVRPQPDFFRKYFPNMERESFDYVFNRYAWVNLDDIRLPVAGVDGFSLPIEVFRPIQNLRRTTLDPGDGGCPAGRDNINAFGLSLHSDGPETTIEGWAPWIGESASQSLFIRTKRPIEVRRLTTVKRPDIAESVHNYQMEKAGFRLVLSTQDRAALSLSELRIAADGTTGGRIWIDGCTAQ